MGTNYYLSSWKFILKKKKKNVHGNYYSRPMMSIYGRLKCMLFSLTIKANENTNLWLHYLSNRA